MYMCTLWPFRREGDNFCVPNCLIWLHHRIVTFWSQCKNFGFAFVLLTTVHVKGLFQQPLLNTFTCDTS